MHRSSLLLDEERSEVNAWVVNSIQSGLFENLNIVEVDNVCDHGLAHSISHMFTRQCRTATTHGPGAAHSEETHVVDPRGGSRGRGGGSRAPHAHE